MSVGISSFRNPGTAGMTGGLALTLALIALIRKSVVFAVVADAVKSPPKSGERSSTVLLPPNAHVVHRPTTRALTAMPIPAARMGHMSLRMSMARPSDARGRQNDGPHLDGAPDHSFAFGA